MRGIRKEDEDHKKNRKFKGKIIVITGASSGIGRQAALDFANKDAGSIILIARSESKLLELKRTLQVVTKSKVTDIVAYACDLSKKEDVLRMGTQILERFGYIDLLINNAGFGEFGRVEDQSIEQIEAVMRTNYFGMVYCTKVFLHSMLLRHSGHIVNVASLAASFGVAGMAGYCASKYAMLGFSESLYHELYGTGVRITVVSPIGVKTNFFNDQSFGDQRPNYTGFMLEARTVSKAILAAANSSRLEIIVPFYIRAGVWFKHTLPYAINPVAGALFRRQLNKAPK
ncbi:MAG TPA: SDR family NAD(P)-dependent oxidoreductase [Candidatus Nitrosopolaris sp.]|nr:SDR family NAD(P)-dependent oxidoreductase [Candidatus Nitrosopolaris sp.]